MGFWIITLLDGLSLAMILFVIAAGLTLIFGLMQIINMAHGSFYLLGGYITFVTAQSTGSYIFAAASAFVLIAVLGAAIQYLCLRSLHKQELPQALLPGGKCGPVAVERILVDQQLDFMAAFRVDEASLAGAELCGIKLLRRRDVYGEYLLAQ